MLVSAVWLAPAVLATINSLAQSRIHGDPLPSARDLLWSGGDWLVYAILTPPIFYVSRLWPIARPRIVSRALLHLLFAVLFCVAWAVSGKILQLSLGLIFTPDTVREFYAKADFWQIVRRDVLSWIFTTLPFGVVVYFSITGIAHAIRYFVEAREREVQMARLSEQLAGARLSTLQAQLNPHFLFNSLNTIAVLTRDGNTTAATRVVEQLSEVLRQTLDRSDASEVSLDDELELVRQYLAVEQARFSDRLRPVFEVDPATLSAAVPSFAIQHLVENALRHGVARRTEAGHVVIATKRRDQSLEVTVTDDGAGMTPDQSTAKGHGLENTRERLRTMYGEGASLELSPGPGGGTIARLIVPYREMVLETEDDGGR